MEQLPGFLIDKVASLLKISKMSGKYGPIKFGTEGRRMVTMVTAVISMGTFVSL